MQTIMQTLQSVSHFGNNLKSTTSVVLCLKLSVLSNRDSGRKLQTFITWSSKKCHYVCYDKNLVYTASMGDL